MSDFKEQPQVVRDGEMLRMPGMATAHSHAFQRALRGRTQRRQTDADSFWSWRGLMYRLAEQLDPEDMFHMARFAFVELAMSGVTAVGEFHYVHHDQQGQPYANRTELSEAVIRAAQAAGIRICLIRTAYLRGGYRQPLAAAQRRFVDADVDTIFQDVATLQSRTADNPLVRVALAAHSIRAVPLHHIVALAEFAAAQQMPFHMHVCEQRRELEESENEYGRTPIAVLAEAGVLSPHFVGVHATHLNQDEIQALGQAQAFVCLCRTTERDLGDGLPPTADLVAAGARLCVGVDSHAAPDAFEEVRAVELDERSRLEVRHAVADAPFLLDVATRQGYAACGLGEAWRADQVWLDGNDAALAGLPDDLLADGVIFGATPRAVRLVEVNGRIIVQDGVHVAYDAALAGYLETLRKLGLA